MLTIESLKRYGAEVDKGLSRCANNEALYLRLVNVMLQELQKDELGAALNAGDLEKAFAVAHKLKGGLTNLALTPLSDPVSELTELLRTKTPGDYAALHAVVVEKTNDLLAL